MVAALYVEINAICIIILGIILFKMWFMGSILGKRTLFVYTLVNAIVLFALDLVWGLLDGTNYAFSHELNLLVNAVYLFQAGHLGYSWYLFNNSVLNCSNRKQLTRHIIATLPLLVLFVSSFSSIWTGWMFSVDEYNVYHREWLYPLQVLVSYAYLIYSAVKAFIYGLKEKTYVKKNRRIDTGIFYYPAIYMWNISGRFYGNSVIKCRNQFIILVCIYFLAGTSDIDGPADRVK